MYAVFNLANKGSAIDASGPSLRILGLNLTLNSSIDFVEQQKIETRSWPMSKASKSEIAINWRLVSTLNLLGLGVQEQHKVLEDEYASFSSRVSSWIEYREKMCKEVFEASQSKTRRPYHQLFAERLLDLKFESLKKLQAANELLKVEASNEPSKFTHEMSRDQEIRGQTWAIIAIVGDSRYETSRNNILETLGLDFFSLCIENLQRKGQWTFDKTLNSDPEVQDYVNSKIDCESPDIQEELALLTFNAKQELECLHKEPLIAFFAASEEPSDLLKQSEELSKLDELKHADIAVVRMYTWLKLSSVSIAKNRIARDPKAQDFFTKMRLAL